MVTGGTTGFVISWYALATTLVVPSAILSIFLGRSLFQQRIHNKEYAQFQENIRRLLEDQDFEKDRKKLMAIIQDIGQFKNRQRNTIKLEDLNWNKNPAIREATEQLGIFETEPNPYGPINLDRNPTLKQMAKQLGLGKEENQKKWIKAKSTNLSELVGEVLENGSESDSDIIDVEVVKESLGIRIRDY
jgi:hypothetical protein